MSIRNVLQLQCKDRVAPVICTIHFPSLKQTFLTFNFKEKEKDNHNEEVDTAS